MPVSILMVVDFPAPFGPSRASSSPGATEKETSRTAVFDERSGATSARSAPRSPGLRTVVRNVIVSPCATIPPVAALPLSR